MTGTPKAPKERRTAAAPAGNNKTSSNKTSNNKTSTNKTSNNKTSSNTSAASESSSTNDLHLGNAGEPHQQATTRDDRLTTNHGAPISDDQNSLRLGQRGPTLLEDFVLREKIFHFDHERIPERVVHARGSGAHGYFECTDSLADLTSASLLQAPGTRVPVFARFSTVAGGAGSVDTPRDVRGFAVKFYTPEGNWDLVGNNIPVFFIQDAIKFPDFVHAVKMEADRGYPQAASAHDTFWDFVSLVPETTHMLLWAMSDRTLPRSLRMMDGFGVNTFRLVNAAGMSTFVKFHWRPTLGVQSTLWDEAVKIAGADPDFHRRDLHDAIEAGSYPSWDLSVQVFDQAFADAQPFDVLDATKLIPEEQVPLRVVGRMTLDRNPDNFFAETEQVAFLPSNVVPGIDFSDDPLLQGRLFSYLDTQHSRLGTANFHQIPINQPKCPFGNFQRDAHMQMAVPTGRANYEPNTLSELGEPAGPREDLRTGFRTHSDATLAGEKVRTRADRFADHYSQATMFWCSQTASEQSHIVAAFVFELSKVDAAHIQTRMLANLGNVAPDLAARVAAGLGVEAPSPSTPAAAPFTTQPSVALSIQANALPELAGRRIAILVAAGSSRQRLDALRASITAAGAAVSVLAPTRYVELDTGAFAADGQLAGNPSVLFDAIALLLTRDATARLTNDVAAVNFVGDAYHHLKAIGLTPEARALLEWSGATSPDQGITDLGTDFLAAAATRWYEREPVLDDAPA